DALLRADMTLNRTNLERWLSHTHALAATHRFFHWPLEFADIFYDESGRVRSAPGFDAVLRSPPWEMLRRDPKEGHGALERRNHSLVRFVRESGLYPSCDRGHMNLYQPFLERALSLAKPGGRVGMILPWGRSTDDGAARLRARLLDRSALDTVVGLDNADAIFPIHRGVRFVVVVAGAGGGQSEGRWGVGQRS